MLFLKHVINHTKRIVALRRKLSSLTDQLVDLTVHDDGIAVVTLKRPPVNSLNLDLLQAMNGVFEDLARKKPKGMILTSASPTVFSAGLDLNEMCKPDIKRIEAFWTALQDVWLQLFGSTYPTAAAINGHAPAAGCLLAMSCEYRVMVSGKYGIGLNESAFGIVVLDMFQDSMKHIISSKQTEIALLSGKMFTVDEALQVGLIDETAINKADTIEKCKKFIEKFDNINPLVRGMTKQIFRQEPMNKLINNRQNDTKKFIDLITQPIMQQALETQLNNVKRKVKT